MRIERVLVTGGCGFIGSNFLHWLHGNVSVEAVNLDCLTYAGSTANVEGLPFGHRVVDICDRGRVLEALCGFAPDVVVNFAAESHVDRSIADAAAFARSNVLGVQVLLDACLKAGVGRFVQVGTDEVYGSLGEDDPPCLPGAPLRPNSPYSASKAAADLLVRSYVRTHGLDCVVTRCTNNYGPRQHPEKLVPKAILNASSDRPVPVYGDGRNRRDWLFVADHCAGIWSAAVRGVSGRVYHFGSGRQPTNREVVEEILRLLGKGGGLLEFVPDRKGHDWRYALDTSSTRRELDWEPSVPLEAGLRLTVDWYGGCR